MSMLLCANLRPVCQHQPAKSLPAVKTRYENVDIIVVRENTEDLYAGIEHMVGEDAAESIKIITRPGQSALCAMPLNLPAGKVVKRLPLYIRANIMKCTDGLFLEVARQVAASTLI